MGSRGVEFSSISPSQPPSTTNRVFLVEYNGIELIKIFPLHMCVLSRQWRNHVNFTWIQSKCYQNLNVILCHFGRKLVPRYHLISYWPLISLLSLVNSLIHLLTERNLYQIIINKYNILWPFNNTKNNGRAIAKNKRCPLLLYHLTHSGTNNRGGNYPSEKYINSTVWWRKIT